MAWLEPLRELDSPGSRISMHGSVRTTKVTLEAPFRITTLRSMHWRTSRLLMKARPSWPSGTFCNRLSRPQRFASLKSASMRLLHEERPVPQQVGPAHHLARKALFVSRGQSMLHQAPTTKSASPQRRPSVDRVV